MSDLQDSLISFADSCNADERLMAMIADWNRVLHIHAEDTSEHFTLITNKGSVVAEDGEPPAPTMVIRSNSETLTQIFYGELSPNEPYNNGTLRIQGTEDDIVRLDFVIAMLWE